MRRTVLAVAVTLVFGSASALAAIHDVSVGGAAGLAYSPSNLTINVGDTVRFTNAGGFHNVVSDTGAVTSFRCAAGCDGSGGNGNASSSSWVAEVTFPTAGTIGFYCEIHGGNGGSGMSGSIVVQAAATPSVEVAPGSVSASAPAGGSASTGFELANTGGATLDCTLDTSSTGCTAPIDVPWIVLAPTSGSIAPGATAASIDVTLDASSLTPGAYNANICVHSNDVANDPLTLPVSFTVNTPDLIFENGFDG
ncbi:MAG: plastocyanin/azurin family copper-binding protein [Dokdonella sp.]|uniref:plastocyanin/azurin family copper-binding protein n=1 Tax=Dokdonella sp. TaxID=2291710 RepID=UPI003F816C35